MSDIKCVGIGGDLVSLIKTASEQKKALLESRNASKSDNGNLKMNINSKFVSSIAYPSNNPSPNLHKMASTTSIANNDSLVTPSLIHMTSYQQQADDEDGDFEAERDMDAAFEEEEEERMSFDDLGKIYTNISRKRILSKVQRLHLLRDFFPSEK